MYFQNLENYHKSGFGLNLNILDSWLASLAPIYRRRISPYDFSVKNNFDIDITLSLFDIAVEMNVLRPKIIIVDDDGNPYGTYYRFCEVPTEIEDIENNRFFHIENHNMEMWYELIDVPKLYPVLEAKESLNVNINNNSPKGIMFSDLKRTGAGATLDALGVDF